MATGQAEAAFKTAMVTNQANIAAFAALPCVTDSGKEYISGLQAATNKTMKSTEREYHDYMAFVTKPMEGNGKCDGGFQGVETEAARRRERSEEAARRIESIEREYRAQTKANLFDPVIIYTNYAGEGCLNSASDGYDSLEAGATSVQAKLEQMRQAMMYEAEQFGIYEARNRGLRISCGEHPETLDGPIRSAAGQGSADRLPAGAYHGGDSNNGQSSITGIEEDAAKRAKEAP